MRLVLATSILIFATLAGCALQRSPLADPGDGEYQRTRALIHDPYPDPDIGPDVVGGRPREFQVPQPEPVRNILWYNR